MLQRPSRVRWRDRLLFSVILMLPAVALADLGRNQLISCSSAFHCCLLLCSYEASLQQGDTDGQVAQLLKKMESHVKARVAAEAAEASAKREVRKRPNTTWRPRCKHMSCWGGCRGKVSSRS